jgi:hypothetical protein
MVRTEMGCELANFPIRYLGLQWARPLTKAEWQPMLDGVIHCAPARQRGLIGRPGRLILIKSVITARPIQHILIEEGFWRKLPNGLGPLLGSKKEVNGGQSLVAWENIAGP